MIYIVPIICKAKSYNELNQLIHLNTCDLSSLTISLELFSQYSRDQERHRTQSEDRAHAYRQDQYEEGAKVRRGLFI